MSGCKAFKVRRTFHLFDLRLTTNNTHRKASQVRRLNRSILIWSRRSLSTFCSLNEALLAASRHMKRCADSLMPTLSNQQ